MLGILQERIAQPGLSQYGLVKLAQRIVDVDAVYEGLDYYQVDSPRDLEYLLQFENPLAMLVDGWDGVMDNFEHMKATIRDTLQEQRTHPNHPRVQPDPVKETVDSGENRPSLLASLHREQERPSPPRDKPAADKPGPEL